MAFRDDKGKVIDVVYDVSSVRKFARGTDNPNVGRGGMISKLDAIEMAHRAGIDCYILSSNEPNALTKIANGEHPATYFPAPCNRK